MDDPEFERLKRKHLAVLNPNPEPVGNLVLDDPGLDPEAAAQGGEPMQTAVISALRSVYDPEIPLNIYDLGLIYGCELSSSAEVRVQMTLTAPGCPVAGTLLQSVHDKVRAVPGVQRVRTELVWDPPWSRERMSEAARLELGLL